MKTKFKHRIVAMTLAMMMTAAPVWGTVHAADEVIGDQPERPVAESYIDNSKIEDYNKKVDEYNKSAEEYNEAVDREYEEASREVAEKNAEIDQHNAAEIERVEAAQERNAQAEKEAEEANAKIDEENAAEEARVIEYNNNEDVKAEASAKARQEAEEKNEAVKAHNEAVAKYAEDKAQHDKEAAQYEQDLKMEQKILAAGYSSVEQYNDMINTHYNNPARASVEKNASANTVSAKDTYSVEEASDKAGASVNVYIEHVFEGTDVRYVDEFEIDRNDTITINSIAALGNATEPGYASLYYNTDEAHSMGYWVPYVEFQYNARYVNSTWNCGSSYEVSYKDGKNHMFDSEDIIAIYTYIWVPQRVYKTYNVPKAPAALENPGEAMEMVEVPELYTPVYQEFIKKDHVEAQLEDIEDANILEHIAEPVKGAYMELLSYMDLFVTPVKEAAMGSTAEAETAEVIPAAVVEIEEAKTAEAAPAAATAQAAPAAAQTAEFEAEEAETAVIADKEVPMAGLKAEGSWALLNLIMTIISGIIAAVLLVGHFNKKDDEDNDENEDGKKHSGIVTLTSVIAAVSTALLFILVEDMSLPMALTDGWTILTAVILLAQAIVSLFAKRSDEEADDEMTEAANA